MSFLTKIFQFVFIGFAFIIFSLLITAMIFSDKQDACLDSGYCKEELQLNIEGKKIIVNEQTCNENNGTWHPDKKVCHFK